MTLRRGTVVWLAAAVAVLLAAGLSGVVSTAKAEDGAIRYVALGDSYTAGPVIPNQAPDPPGCSRSDHNYPHLVAAWTGAELRDVSCSGATTKDLFAPQAVRGGANEPQLATLSADATLVTVGIGGNDIGFGDIVVSCLAVSPLGTPCRDRHVGPGGDRISARIAETAPRIATVLAEIGRRAPSADVLVVGYPAILPDTYDGCWPVMPVAWQDVRYLRDKEKELNAMLAQQAAAAGARYVDTYGPSQGHDACALPGVRWVEPVVPLAPAAPVHPNADGMQATARAVVLALAVTAAAGG
ncbi:MAG: SGNH/GDSL hydrolase family protein [Acidimicrobiales bacterium]